ncbi:hypothetical protein EON65_48975 [archaeon]|nr:MAG: hypothetical protein EON65_48975 [archaeon]
MLLDEREFDDENAEVYGEEFVENLQDIEGLQGDIDELSGMLEEDFADRDMTLKKTTEEVPAVLPSAEGSSKRGKGFSVIGSVPGSLEDLDSLIARTTRQIRSSSSRPEGGNKGRGGGDSSGKNVKKGKSSAKTKRGNTRKSSDDLEIEVEQRVIESDRDLDVLEHIGVSCSSKKVTKR